MADAERKQDHRGSGIELSTRPQYQELQANPGLEVLAPSELEVVPPKPSYSPTTYGQEKKLGDDAYYSPQTPYHVAPPYGFNSPYDNAPLMAPPVPARMAGATERRVLGLKRQTFFIILAIAIFLAVVAVAVGVGVGIAMRGKTDSPAASPPPTTTSTLPTPVPTHNPLFPLPTANALASPSTQILCPSNNLTLYTPSSSLPSISSKRFLLLCGRDYNSGAGTIDLYNTETATMTECINTCAEQEGCVGAGWGDYNGRDVCWLKSKLATAQKSSAWYFAALDGEVVA